MMRKPKDVVIEGMTLQEILERHGHWLDHDCPGWESMRADLSGADLHDTDLRNTRLTGADMSGADLSGADLRGADMRDTDLSYANLSGASIGTAKMPDAGGQGTTKERMQVLVDKMIELVHITSGRQGGRISRHTGIDSLKGEGAGNSMKDAEVNISLRKADLRTARLKDTVLESAVAGDADPAKVADTAAKYSRIITGCTVSYNQETGSITLTIADGGSTGAADEIMKDIFGPEATGDKKTAVTPKGAVFTEEDALETRMYINGLNMHISAVKDGRICDLPKVIEADMIMHRAFENIRWGKPYYEAQKTAASVRNADAARSL